jgi:hypothetical protein
MALIGHAAASFNIFLDIPLFLRGVSQGIHGTNGPVIHLTPQMWVDLFNDDPTDPTAIVTEYLYDWWNSEQEWKTQSVECDQEAAYQWHFEKVK